MAKVNLQFYQKKIAQKIKTGDKMIRLIAEECEERGLDFSEVMKYAHEHFKVAKTTAYNWMDANPKTFDTAGFIFKSMDELELKKLK